MRGDFNSDTSKRNEITSNQIASILFLNFDFNRATKGSVHYQNFNLIFVYQTISEHVQLCNNF